MAAGISHERKYRITYRFLHKMLRELSVKGVVGKYQSWEIHGNHNGKFWQIWYSWGNMSNGESVGMCYVGVDGVGDHPMSDPVETLIKRLAA